MRRRAGSVTFDPYYKVQWWDATTVAWRDVQRAFPDQTEARQYAPGLVPAEATRCRLMEVTMAGRRPLEEFTIEEWER